MDLSSPALQPWQEWLRKYHILTEILDHLNDLTWIDVRFLYQWSVRISVFPLVITCLRFLVADWRLYKRLCPSVAPLVRVIEFRKCENAQYRPCPPVRDWYWPCIRPCSQISVVSLWSWKRILSSIALSDRVFRLSSQFCVNLFGFNDKLFMLTWWFSLTPSISGWFWGLWALPCSYLIQSNSEKSSCLDWRQLNLNWWN